MTAPAVIVLGAGLAGAACAATLAGAGCRVRVVAPDRGVADRGETLSPRAAPVLERLGWRDLLGPETALPGEDRYSVWGAPRLARAPSPPGEGGGWHLDRVALEGAVRARIARGGIEQVDGMAREIRQSADAVEVELSDGHGLRGDFLADCTGRTAVTAAPGARRRLDRLTALHASLVLDDDVEVATATLVEAVPGGWWYSSSGPGRRLAVAFFSDSDLMPGGISKDPAVWASLVAGAPATASRLESLGTGLATTCPDVAAAATVVSTSLWDRRVVRAGDAVAALDPLASNGLAAALWSGVKTADAILGLSAGSATVVRHYEAALLEGVAAQLQAQAGMYGGEYRFSSHPFWSRRTQLATQASG